MNQGNANSLHIELFGTKNLHQHFERTAVIFLYFFITKISSLCYCFFTFSLSENRKVRLIRVFLQQNAKFVSKERGSINPGFAWSEFTYKSFLWKKNEIQGDLQKVRITKEFGCIQYSGKNHWRKAGNGSFDLSHKALSYQLIKKFCIVVSDYLLPSSAT